MANDNFKVELEELNEKLEHWRANKKSRGDKMPDSLWREIIALVPQYQEQSKFCRILGITKTQLKSKMRQFGNEAVFNDPVELCSINKIEDSQGFAGSEDQFSALSTIVVEFCRKDGCTMKIHTTTQSIQDVIDKFLEGNNVAAYS